MISIYINGRFLGAKMSGVPRYGRELLRHLDDLLVQLQSKAKVEILIPPGVQVGESYERLPVRRVGRLTGHAWEQLELPFFAGGGILFTPTGSAPLLHRRNILTIHDAIVFAAPAGFSRSYIIWYRILSRVLCHTAIQVLTVSHFSKSELIRWCNADPKAISVIYPGAQHLKSIVADDSIQQTHALKKYGYVLAVGSSSPNKNFRGLIAARPFLDDSGIEVVLVGQTGLQVGQHGSQKEGLNTTRVKDLGHVSDAELRSLYENAGCFVFPSLYEGFGIPPLEALSLGCPVVVSNRASLPEVCGEVALLCDPLDPKDIADKVKQAVKLRKDPNNAEQFKIFASRYTYHKCATNTWEVLSQAALGMSTDGNLTSAD